MATPTPHKPTTPSDRELDRLQARVAELEEQLAREQARKQRLLTAGRLAEQRHQLLDLDADSRAVVPGATCLLCPPRTPGGAS